MQFGKSNKDQKHLQVSAFNTVRISQQQTFVNRTCDIHSEPEPIKKYKSLLSYFT